MSLLAGGRRIGIEGVDQHVHVGGLDHDVAVQPEVGQAVRQDQAQLLGNQGVPRLQEDEVIVRIIKVCIVRCDVGVPKESRIH